MTLHNDYMDGRNTPKRVRVLGSRGEGRGRFKNTYGLFNIKALKFSPVNKIQIFQCMGKIFYGEFQRYSLKFHIKFLTIHWKKLFFYNTEIWRALRFKSSYAFSKRPQVPIRNIPFHIFLYGFENDAGLFGWNCVDTTNTYMYIWALLVQFYQCKKGWCFLL